MHRATRAAHREVNGDDRVARRGAWCYGYLVELPPEAAAVVV